jgi:hypothetical protein
MCPKCSGAVSQPGKNPALERTLAAIPPLAAELHPSSGLPEQISYGSNGPVTWWHQVPAVRPGSGDWYLTTHIWGDGEKKQPPKSRTSRHESNGQSAGVNGCPICNSDQADDSNSLASWYPELASQWVSSTSGRTPANTPVGSKIEVIWTCPNDVHKTWSAPPNRRTAKALRSGCPQCSKNLSDKQVALFHELRTQLPDLELEAPVLLEPTPSDRYSVARVDMRDEATRLIVEFDGWKFHGPCAPRDRRDYDRRKTQRLHDAGETVIRVREDLDPIGPYDVVVGAGWSAWQVALTVLKRVAQLGLCPLPELAAYEGRGTAAAAATTEAALLGERYQPRTILKTKSKSKEPRPLTATEPHPGSRLIPTGPPYANPRARVGALRDYECSCGRRLIGAVQADVARGNTLSCGCLATEIKRQTRGRSDRSLTQAARRWARSQGIDVPQNGALDARTLTTHRLVAAGVVGMLGPDGLIPEQSVREWALQRGIPPLARGRLSKGAWDEYAEAHLPSVPS